MCYRREITNKFVIPIREVVISSLVIPKVEAVQTPQPTQPTESKPTNWPKIILVAVLGLALLAGAASAGYWYGTQQAQQLEKPTPVVSQPTPTPTPTIEDETKDWKTYTGTSSARDYLFKYPPTMTPRQLPQGMPVNFQLVDTNIDMSSQTVGLTIPAEEFIRREFNGLPRVDQNIGPIAGEVEEQKIEGAKVFRLEGTVNGLPIIRLVIPLGKDEWGNDIYLDVRAWHTDEADKNTDTLKAEFDQILSTFKFLD